MISVTRSARSDSRKTIKTETEVNPCGSTSQQELPVGRRTTEMRNEGCSYVLIQQKINMTKHSSGSPAASQVERKYTHTQQTLEAATVSPRILRRFAPSKPDDTCLPSRLLHFLIGLLIFDSPLSIRSSCRNPIAIEFIFIFIFKAHRAAFWCPACDRLYLGFALPKNHDMV